MPSEQCNCLLSWFLQKAPIRKVPTSPESSIPYPSLLVLDEATSAIDVKTEEAILDDLLSSSDDLTVVLITHRVDIAHRFDRIYRVERGHVLEVTDEFRKNRPTV